MNKLKVKQISSIVEKLWSDYSLQPGFDIENLVKSHGIDYKVMRFKDNISGLFMIHEDKKFICVNESESFERQRFSAGHELGHFYLHKTNPLSVFKSEVMFFRDEDSSKGSVKEEVEANYFSASLLMPAFSIEKEIDFKLIIDENIKLLAPKYRVSAAAMAIRLNTLGYC